MKTKNTEPDTKDLLTPREVKILTLIAKGLAKKEIAEQLNISEYTVISHTRSIYKKLNAVNAPSAINKAHILGFFSSGR